MKEYSIIASNADLLAWVICHKKISICFASLCRAYTLINRLLWYQQCGEYDLKWNQRVKDLGHTSDIRLTLFTMFRTISSKDLAFENHYRGDMHVSCMHGLLGSWRRIFPQFQSWSSITLALRITERTHFCYSSPPKKTMRKKLKL